MIHCSQIGFNFWVCVKPLLLKSTFSIFLKISPNIWDRIWIDKVFSTQLMLMLWICSVSAEVSSPCKPDRKFSYLHGFNALQILYSFPKLSTFYFLCYLLQINHRFPVISWFGGSDGLIEWNRMSDLWAVDQAYASLLVYIWFVCERILKDKWI